MAYDHVFDASVDVLRDYHFVVARQDRRFGIITTEPMTAASYFEPWHEDSTTHHQRAENTLNHQRRLVTVKITPNPDPTSDQRYVLFVDCQLERRRHPPIMLNTAAFGTRQFRQRGTGSRFIRTEQGAEGSTWVPVGNDPDLAARIAEQIIARVAATDTLANRR